MQKLILIILLATSLFSRNPDVYAALGDVIYNNVEAIDKLKNINQFDIYKTKIEKYIQKVYTTKELGFRIEKGDKGVDKKVYLSNLRALAKDNDFFQRMVQKSYQSSLKNENSQLFSKLINSGLIDTEQYKQEIIDYYFAHQEDINATGVIQSYMDADTKLQEKKEAELKKINLKRERELKRIKRIRAKDKREQEALEEKLEKEVKKKKEEVRKEQKEELLKTR